MFTEMQCSLVHFREGSSQISQAPKIAERQWYGSIQEVPMNIAESK